MNLFARLRHLSVRKDVEMAVRTGSEQVELPREREWPNERNSAERQKISSVYFQACVRVYIANGSPLIGRKRRSSRYYCDLQSDTPTASIYMKLYYTHWNENLT